MRLVNWQEFIALPAGTIYSEPGTMAQGAGLRMKGDTWSHNGATSDYVDTDLLPHAMDADSIFHSEFPDQTPDAGNTVVVHPGGWARDGMFDRSRSYLIWETEDRQRLARWLLNPDEVADGDELNEDNVRWRGQRAELDGEKV